MSEERTNTPQNDILHDRFVRWQQITLQQLTYAINLILAFSGATIGFDITIALNDKFNLPGPGKWLFMLSLSLLAASMAFGILAVVNRLRDFRLTTRTARLRWKSPDAAEIDCLTNETSRLGNVTWCLFYLQTGFFSGGILFSAFVMFAFIASLPL
jgi:hypothetical protein